MTTLTKKIDEKIDQAIAKGTEPDYVAISEEVLQETLSRKERREALELGVRLRARYRLRARSQQRGGVAA